MKKIGYIIWAMILSCVTFQCGTLEDCVTEAGVVEVQSRAVFPFDAIHVKDGVSLTIVHADRHAVEVIAGQNIQHDIYVRVVDGILFIDNLLECNWVRSFENVHIKVSTPRLTRIESYTSLPIRSEGVLRFPDLRIQSLLQNGEAGTGRFNLTIDNEVLTVESNNVSDFQIQGETAVFYAHFYAGYGKLDASGLRARHIDVFHRGVNDMYLYPTETVTGFVLSTGSVYLLNEPPVNNLTTHYTGQIILP